MKNMRYMRESTSKISSEVRNWSATSKLLDKFSKNNLLVSTSTSLRSCPPPLVSVSQWFTSRTRNSRYLTSFFIRLGATGEAFSIPMKRQAEPQVYNRESVSPHERDFWNELPKAQIVLKLPDNADNVKYMS